VICLADILFMLFRFVTGCSRGPLLGFKHLEPQFCIQRYVLPISFYTSHMHNMNGMDSMILGKNHSNDTVQPSKGNSSLWWNLLVLCRAASAPDDQSAETLDRLPTSATCMNLLKLPPYKRWAPCSHLSSASSSCHWHLFAVFCEALSAP